MTLKAKGSFGPDSIFRFSCHKGLPCFTTCCRDVNIVLMPYDIIRMKERLGMSSEEFLRSHTLTVISETTGLPLVLLRMREDEGRTCPFVEESGCTIYEDRPWACRMYPLEQSCSEGPYSLMVGPQRCLGLNEDMEWILEDWMVSQGILHYEAMGRAFWDLTSKTSMLGLKVTNPRIVDMFYMACYDLDRFRRFVLDGRFLNTFYLDNEMVERARTDDVELMHLALRWLKFGLVERKALKLRDEVLREKGPVSDKR